jgi:hypothetical protein
MLLKYPEILSWNEIPSKTMASACPASGTTLVASAGLPSGLKTGFMPSRSVIGSRIPELTHARKRCLNALRTDRIGSTQAKEEDYETAEMKRRKIANSRLVMVRRFP